MIRYKKTLICRKCGKPFTITLNDAVYPWQVRLINNPICPCCRIKGGVTRKAMGK